MNFLSRNEINASYISFLSAHPQCGELPYSATFDYYRFLSLEEVASLLGFESADLAGFILANPKIVPFLNFGSDVFFEREKIFSWFLEQVKPLLMEQNQKNIIS